MPTSVYRRIAEQDVIDDSQAFRLIEEIIRVHTNNIEDEDGGERPFNEGGEAIEAISAIVEGDYNKPMRDGWFDQ